MAERDKVKFTVCVCVCGSPLQVLAVHYHGNIFLNDRYGEERLFRCGGVSGQERQRMVDRRSHTHTHNSKHSIVTTNLHSPGTSQKKKNFNIILL